MKRSILFAGTAILAACASSPANIGGLAGEPVDFFAQAPDAPAEWTASGVAGKAPKGDWLSQFNDPVMMSLVAEALENNPTLKSRAATMAPVPYTILSCVEYPLIRYSGELDRMGGIVPLPAYRSQCFAHKNIGPVSA